MSNNTIRQPASNFDNTKFQLAKSMTDAEYAGYVRGMYDCGCERCFDKLQYEETEQFLTENENEQLYIFFRIGQKELILNRELTKDEKKAIGLQVVDERLFVENTIRQVNAI